MSPALCDVFLIACDVRGAQFCLESLISPALQACLGSGSVGGAQRAVT